MTERPSDQQAPTAPRQCTEHTVTLEDGTALFYHAWLPDAPSRHALLLFHRGHEHSARWQKTVEALALDDVAIFALGRAWARAVARRAPRSSYGLRYGKPYIPLHRRVA